MKRTIIIIGLILIVGFYLPVTGINTVYATVDCEDINQNNIPTNAEYEKKTVDDFNRENELKNYEFIKTNTEKISEKLKKIEKEKKNIEGKIKEAKSINNDSNNLKKKLIEKNKELIETKSKLKNFKSSLEYIEKKSLFKQAKIVEEYRQIISATEERGKNLKKEEEGCQSCSDEQRKILKLRVKANAQYIESLRAEMNKKVCKTEKGKDCEKEIETAKEWGSCVTNTIGEISSLESIRERGRTFDVSDIFSLKNTTPDSDVEPKSFIDVTNKIAGWMITLVSSLAVTTLIIGGFLMIISGGDEGRLETGKTIFTYSLIGIVVTLMAYGIIAFIQSIFYSL